MQAIQSGSADSSSSNSPHRPDSVSKRKTVHVHRPTPDQPPSPSRVVLAEGSEFVLEPVPSRGTPTKSRSSSAARHVSAPYLSKSSSPASSQLSPQSSPQLRSVSASVTPPRFRQQADRPYRPPPSSSARFYERQQQLWQLQQPSLLPPITASYVTSSSLYSHASGNNTSVPQHSSAPRFGASQPAAPPFSQLAQHDLVSTTLRSQGEPAASATARLRATSVSSLGPPEDRHTGNRARSGSDAGSFTRSRVSNGYHSATDDESFDQGPAMAVDSSTSLAADQQSSAAEAPSALASPHRSTVVTTVPEGSGPDPSRKLHRHSSLTVTPGDSVDTDWDLELGIAEGDYAQPLRLPLLPQGKTCLHPPATVTADLLTEQATASSNIVLSSVSTAVSTDSHLEGLHAADLKGIRVTSAVNESWDDDFLFQNDEDPGESTSQSSSSAPRHLANHRSSSNTAATSKSPLRLGVEDAEVDEDVENWDDAFSWNADSILTPSASVTPSFHDSMRFSNTQHSSLQGNAYQRGQVSPRRPPPRGRHQATTDSQKRSSTSSYASDTTDLSARLAAQSDVGSNRQRPSRDSEDLGYPHLMSSSRQRDAIGLIGTERQVQPSFEVGSDGSGDDTETETPSKEAAPIKGRSVRRSLGAALGFDPQRKSTERDFTMSAQASSHAKKKDHAELIAAKSHTRSQSKSRLGAFQRLSFYRSRINVANASSLSVNGTLEGSQSPQRMYSDHMNQSQASLASQSSTSSIPTRKDASPSNLEKSYVALRSTSFRRLLGRSGQGSKLASSGHEPTVTPPVSPPRRRLDLVSPSHAAYSPPRDTPPTLDSAPSMSPPSARLELRRSTQATPTRSKDRSGRRNSNSVYRKAPGQPFGAVFGSPNQLPVCSGDAAVWNERTMTLGLDDPNDFDRLDGKPSLKQAGDSLHGLGHVPAAGLHRDFSSSTTLRADLSYGGEDVPSPMRIGLDGAHPDASARHVPPAYRQSDAHNRSDEAIVNGPVASSFPYLSEPMLRGSENRGSASRSVSASTAHSQASNGSVYGYRMRKQISVSSGHEAHDSETSYGTSVGSSPGLSDPSSSGWASYGKRGGTPSADTRDTVLSASVDSIRRNGLLKAPADDSRHATIVPSSSMYLERTIEGNPVIDPRTVRQLSAPDTSLSQSRLSAPSHSESFGADSPGMSSERLPLRAAEQSPVRQASLTANKTAPAIPVVNSATLDATSLQRSAARRNSLSDLKIPSRISKAQTGIRNNISLVRDFAKGIEELKTLKASYMDHRMMRSMPAASEAQDRVQNWLDCADVLIGLGEGRSEADSAARVDTLTHTPLPVRVDSRRTTLSDASSYGGPISPLEGAASRQSSYTGARSTSGTSQGTTSTTDSTRSIDVQREIDILSAILGGTRPTSSRSGSGSHGRIQSETYTRDSLPRRNIDYSSPYQRASAATSLGRSNTETLDRGSFERRISAKDSRAEASDRLFNTAPTISGAGADVTSLDIVDVGDANRSAKRRVRSASRAGLQGLRELLKVFKGAAANDTAATSSQPTDATELGASRDGLNAETRDSMDARPLTPAKQKRKSLDFKRRSFLRSKSSLESIQAKSASKSTAQEVTPPMPNPANLGRYAVPTVKAEQRKQGPSTSKTSLDITWEAGSRDGRDSKELSSTVKSSRRISLQSAMSNMKRRSMEARPRADEAIPRSAGSRSSKADGSRRPGSGTKQRESAGVVSDARRASTSVDCLQYRPGVPLRSQTSLEAQSLQTPMVQKLALRPEAMPGLLVYVQATKQHLQAAIEELSTPIQSPK